jgi:hypothetical protein
MTQSLVGLNLLGAVVEAEDIHEIDARTLLCRLTLEDGSSVLGYFNAQPGQEVSDADKLRLAQDDAKQKVWRKRRDDRPVGRRVRA